MIDDVLINSIKLMDYPKTPPQKVYDIILPADDFVGEENPLHLWVFDMVASLILHHLEKVNFNLHYPPIYVGTTEKATSPSFGC